MDNPSTPKTTQDYVRLYFSGIAMGAADIVPGVSGGTMAFILGFYEDLINGIKSFDVEVVKLILRGKIGDALAHVPYKFLITLGLGILTAIVTLARSLSWMLENEPEYLFAFFFGLVLASIVAIGAKIDKWTPSVLLGLIGGAVGAYIIVGLTPTSDADHSTITLFLSGVVAIMAMILPGISGSFILLLLGQYEYVLNAVKDFDFVTVFTVAVGAVVGIIGFSRVLSWLLRHYERFTIALLTGFMIGSLRKIWPWREKIENLSGGAAEHAEEFTRAVLPDLASQEFLLGLALCVIGFALVSILDHAQSKSNPVILFFQRLTGMRQAQPSEA